MKVNGVRHAGKVCAMETPHLVLIGLRGCGKSTLAGLLAQELSYDVIDTDPLVLEGLRTSGVDSIADVFEKLGEAVFREAEADLLRELLMSDTPRLISTGGGMPTAPGCAELLQQASQDGRARVLYLRAKPDVLAARVAGDAQTASLRPSLTGQSPVDEMAEVFQARDPLYQWLADEILDANLTPEALAKQVG